MRLMHYEGSALGKFQPSLACDGQSLCPGTARLYE